MTTKEKQALEDRGLIRWQMLLGSEVPDGQRAALNGQPDKHLADKLPQNGRYHAPDPA
jgi:hypothetical protein